MLILTTIFKLIYIHIAFSAFGIDHEYFYIARANYFSDLGMFNHAIGNYKKALEFSDDPKVLAALAWCYSQIDQLDISLKYYRSASKKSPNNIDILIGLAYVELYNGNIIESKKIINNRLVDASSEKHIKEIENLHNLIMDAENKDLNSGVIDNK